MIKGIVGCKVKKDEDVESLLLKLKSHAMQYPGFKGAENLVSEENTSIVAMVSTWEKLEDWRLWGESGITKELFQEARTLLTEEPRVTTFRMITPQMTWA